MANPLQALTNLGITAPCARPTFDLGLGKVAHIMMRTRHGKYLIKRYAAKLGTMASRSATVSLRAL